MARMSPCLIFIGILFYFMEADGWDQQEGNLWLRKQMRFLLCKSDRDQIDVLLLWAQNTGMCLMSFLPVPWGGFITPNNCDSIMHWYIFNVKWNEWLVMRMMRYVFSVFTLTLWDFGLFIGNLIANSVKELYKGGRMDEDFVFWEGIQDRV